jgi:hypothetical protein
MTQLTLVQTQLLTNFLQPLFYGIYIVTLGFCLKCLLTDDQSNQFTSSSRTLSFNLAVPKGPSRWKRISDINKTMFMVAILMALIATLDMLLSFVKGWDAFTSADRNGPSGVRSAEDILAEGGGWMDIVGVSVFFLSSCHLSPLLRNFGFLLL